MVVDGVVVGVIYLVVVSLLLLFLPMLPAQTRKMDPPDGTPQNFPQGNPRRKNDLSDLVNIMGLIWGPID